MYAFSSKLAVLAMVFAFAFPMQAQAQEGTDRRLAIQQFLAGCVIAHYLSPD